MNRSTNLSWDTAEEKCMWNPAPYSVKTLVTDLSRVMVNPGASAVTVCGCAQYMSAITISQVCRTLPSFFFVGLCWEFNFFSCSRMEIKRISEMYRRWESTHCTSSERITFKGTFFFFFFKSVDDIFSASWKSFHWYSDLFLLFHSFFWNVSSRINQKSCCNFLNSWIFLVPLFIWHHIPTGSCPRDGAKIFICFPYRLSSPCTRSLVTILLLPSIPHSIFLYQFLSSPVTN